MTSKKQKLFASKPWIRRITLALLALVAGITIVVGYIFLEDRSYAPYEFPGVKPENRLGVLITWDASEGEEDPWAEYKEGLAPGLRELHAASKVEVVLPFSHPSLKHPQSPGSWRHSVFILLKDTPDQDTVIQKLSTLAQQEPFRDLLQSLDVLRLQNGLDLLYPITDGLARESSLNQSLEFVFSKPEARSEYYNTQYIWSGPAMADLHSRDKAGRFIGFEVKERIYGKSSMPQWDLVHIFGFTPWQSAKASLVFFPTWNKHARRVFGPEATFESVIKAWDKIRLKLQEEAQQNFDLTLQSNGAK